MKRLGRAVNRILTARPVVWSLVLLLLVLGVAPSWSEEGTGTPLALGYINSDGETGFVELVAAEPLQEDLVAATALGVPVEPLGHQLVRLTNVERANNGLAPLKAASELMDSAQYHSDWMASHNCFSHNCPGEPYWVTRIESAGYVNWVLLGENIARGYSSANGAVQAWMNSTEGHRENMLNPDFREAGGGYAYSSTSYWTMDYGARNDSQGNPVYPAVINGEAWSTTSLQVQLYVYGQGWAQEMSFSNDGVTWSPWEPYSCNKAWPLSAGGGSPAVVHARIRRISPVLQVLESADDIHLEPHLTVTPSTMVFLWPKDSPDMVPAEYRMIIDTFGDWTAVPDQDWIKLSEPAGTGQATVNVHLEGFPTGVETHTGTITVEAGGMSAQVQVTLVVTDGPLQKNHVPVSTKVQV